MIGLTYKDTITIYDSAYDGYGDETVAEQADVKCLFLQGTGTAHSANVDDIFADAHAYIDPKNEFASSRAYMLEGMLVKANMFDGPEDESWYRIRLIRVGQDKLLTNKIDNVHAFLMKGRGI